MMLNSTKLQAVIAKALEDAVGSPAWVAAICRAAQELQSNPYIHYTDGETLMLSPSNNIYTANGTCGCKAYANRRPCWHRAANRLLVRYNQN